MATQFITQDDLNQLGATSDAVTKLLDSTEATLLEDTEANILYTIREHIGQQYDLDAEFAKTGGDRHKKLIWCAANLVLFELYDRKHMGGNRKNGFFRNRMEALEWLKDIQSGKISPELAVLENNAGESAYLSSFQVRNSDNHNRWA